MKNFMLIMAVVFSIAAIAVSVSAEETSKRPPQGLIKAATLSAELGSMQIRSDSQKAVTVRAEGDTNVYLIHWPVQMTLVKSFAEGDSTKDVDLDRSIFINLDENDVVIERFSPEYSVSFAKQ